MDPRRFPPSGPTLARYLQMAIVSEIAVSPTSNIGTCPVMFFCFHSLAAYIYSLAMITSIGALAMDAVARQS